MAESTPTKTFMGRLFRRDGWVNLLAGFGKRYTDKTKDTYFEAPTILQEQELADMWTGDGLGARVVSIPPADMVRRWIEVPADEEEKILQEMQRLNAKQKFSQALSWARLYGGALIVMVTKNGGKLEEPLRKGVTGIEKLMVYSSYEVQLDTTDFVTDENSPYFGEVETYRIQTLQGMVIRIHTSRCLVFKGISAPRGASNIDIKMKYWGLSVLQQMWDRIKNFGAVEQGIANLMYEVIIGKYKLSNLAQILSEGNTEAVYNRMEIINSSKSLINAVLLDEKEDYTRDTANLTGIPEVIDRFMMIISGISGIPVTRLWGRSPAGENATGESDLRNYYDMVGALQETNLQPPLQKLAILINSYLKATKDPSIKFLPVWTPTEKEQTDMDKTRADMYNVYLTQMVLSPDEVRQMEFPEVDEMGEEAGKPTGEEMGEGEAG